MALSFMSVLKRDACSICLNTSVLSFFVLNLYKKCLKTLCAILYKICKNCTVNKSKMMYV